MKCILNGKILRDNKIIENKGLLFNDRILGIIDIEKIPKDAEIIDARGNYVSAGFINAHIHGIMGFDTMDEKGIENISKEIIKTGVTSFLGTTVTSDYKTLDNLFDKLPDNKDLKGAKFLGIHLEGPYISMEKLGAHKKEYQKKPDIEFIKKYKDIIKMVTYAPEEDSDGGFLKYLKENTNIVASIGHTNGSKDEILKAVRDGCENFTHLFNAMTGIHHRKPGAVSVGLLEDVYVEIIPDNIHIDRYLYELIVRTKSSDKIIIISDSMKAAGMADGRYKLGELDVIVKDNKATLENGTLAGSILEINTGLKNFIENSSVSIEDAINYVSKNPAKMLKLKDIGELKENYVSDICIFDENINIKSVYAKGIKVY